MNYISYIRQFSPSIVIKTYLTKQLVIICNLSTIKWLNYKTSDKTIIVLELKMTQLPSCISTHSVTKRLPNSMPI